MSNYPELKTIRDFLRFATSRFNAEGLYFGHGTDNAWDDAVALTLHTLHLPHDIDKTVLSAHLIEAEREQLLSVIDKRVNARIPVPYLTHEAWFANLPFYVDKRVLIPRSPIAELIQNHFEPWIGPENRINRILDLGTGCGCIAIACALAFPHANITASDNSKDALAVAKINLLRHSVQDQVELVASDLFTGLPKEKYDLIVSNPPYVSVAEMADLPAEYLHEPQTGLAAGTVGLDFVIGILSEAEDYLSDKGVLIVEVGNSETALMENFPTIPFTWIDFERGGGGVFLLTKSELQAHRDSFK